MIELPQMAALVLAALGAGVVDAIAGGGGLLTLPALLASGLPPHLALGTNKGQSVFGSASSLLAYARAGRVDPARAPRSFAAGFAGSLAGAALVMVVDPDRLKPLIVVLLVVAAVMVTVVRPPVGTADRRPRVVAGLAVAGAIGMYDGFFGPGTGTLLIVLNVALLGDDLVAASANAKVVNFASNLAAVLLFASQGAVLWPLAVAMGLAQFVGGQIGPRLAIRGGQKVVRGVALTVMAALVVKIVWQMAAG